MFLLQVLWSYVHGKRLERYGQKKINTTLLFLNRSHHKAAETAKLVAYCSIRGLNSFELTTDLCWYTRPRVRVPVAPPTSRVTQEYSSKHLGYRIERPRLWRRQLANQSTSQPTVADMEMGGARYLSCDTARNSSKAAAPDARRRPTVGLLRCNRATVGVRVPMPTRAQYIRVCALWRCLVKPLADCDGFNH